MADQNIPKCIWSGKKDRDVKKVTFQSVELAGVPKEKTCFVRPEHEEKLRKFNRKMVKNARLFVNLMIGFLLLFYIFGFAALIFPAPKSLVLVSAGLLISAMGVTIILLPFSTPQTVRWLGLRKAIKVMRISGFLLILFGMGVSLLSFF